jgi:predicted small lipoprotein YifL
VNVLSLLVASACAAALVGCTVKGPEVRVKPPIEVTVEKESGKDGTFCPPGQAKKGRC